MHCAHFSHYTLYPLRDALAFWSVWCGKCAQRAFFHTIHSLSLARRSRIALLTNTGGARLLEGMVWKMHCAFFHTIHSLSLARQSRIALLTNTGGARLLECMVWKMRRAHFPHHTLHPLRGEG